MKTLIPFLKRYNKDILFSSIGVIIVAFATLWQPHLLQNMISAIMANDNSNIVNLGTQLVALALVGIIAGVFNTYFAAKVAQGVAADMREATYRKIQSFSLSNIEELSSANLVVRMTNDINQVQLIIMNFLQQIMRVPILFIGAFVLSVITLPQLWWMIIVMMIAIVLVCAFSFTKMGKYFGKIQTYIENNNRLARENLMGMRVVKSFVQEDSQYKNFEKSSDEMTGLTIVIGNLFSIIVPSFFLIGNLAVAASIFLIGDMVNTNPDLLASITAFTQYLMQILFAIITAGLMLTTSSRAFVSLKRLQEIFETKPGLQFPDVAPEKLDGSVEFDHVSFTYPGDDEPTIKDVSFSAKPGEQIGIVGATGSGKSTLAQLIPRLYDPQEGVVKVGGKNIKDVNQKSLQEAISFVLQRSTLFSGTIAENLRQGNENATLEDMKWAANIAQASEFIEKLDGKYDAKVEERSANFSGGQKQRLSITRGVISHPEILILDDSTSALDAQSEKKVQEALDKDLKGTTTFIISEKISSIINANKILVLDHGKIVGVGTHEELVKNNEYYQEIYNTQIAKDE
ncbi:ABC transporter ATP-binding protein [Holzapfeliella sp. JNUCC 72]